MRRTDSQDDELISTTIEEISEKWGGSKARIRNAILQVSGVAVFNGAVEADPGSLKDLRAQIRSATAS